MRNTRLVLTSALTLLLAISSFQSSATTRNTYSNKCGSSSSGSSSGDTSTTDSSIGSTPDPYYDTEACDAWSTQQTYDLYQYDSSENQWYANYNNGVDPYNSYSSDHLSKVTTVDVEGVEVNVAVTGISDSTNGYLQYEDNLPYYWSGDDFGMGLKNSVEENYENNGYNLGSNHAIDNSTSNDMLLFSFSEAVTLTGATFSWASGFDITVAAVDISNLQDNTAYSWSDIANSFTMSGGVGSFTMEECPPGYVSEFTGITASSKYWLVGAYNTAFDSQNLLSNGNDFVKLASLGITRSGEPVDNGSSDPVNAPASFALIALAGLVVVRRRKAA